MVQTIPVRDISLYELEKNLVCNLPQIPTSLWIENLAILTDDQK
ncbi:hypothetical protein [Nostoc sp.]